MRYHGVVFSDVRPVPTSLPPVVYIYPTGWKRDGTGYMKTIHPRFFRPFFLPFALLFILHSIIINITSSSSSTSLRTTNLLGRSSRTTTTQIHRVTPPTTPTPMMMVVMSPPLLPTALTRRQALHDPIPRQHAAVDREVPAHHERAHGGVLLRQPVGRVGQVRLVLAPVDED